MSKLGNCQKGSSAKPNFDDLTVIVISSNMFDKMRLEKIRKNVINFTKGIT